MYRHFKGAVNYNLPNLYNVYKTLVFGNAYSK